MISRSIIQNSNHRPAPQVTRSSKIGRYVRRHISTAVTHPYWGDCSVFISDAAQPLREPWVMASSSACGPPLCISTFSLLVSLLSSAKPTSKFSECRLEVLPERQCPGHRRQFATLPNLREMLVFLPTEEVGTHKISRHVLSGSWYQTRRAQTLNDVAGRRTLSSSHIKLTVQLKVGWERTR